MATLLISLVAIAVWSFILYFIVKLAVASALEQNARSLNTVIETVIETLNAQLSLTKQVAKHLHAQSDLMIIEAYHAGMKDEQLEPVLAQIAEHKIAVEAMPTSLPFK